MPRAPADQKKSKRDSRLRPVSNVKWDPFGWVLPEGPKRPAKEVEHNVNGLETKPSFYAMVKKALLANKMHYLRGVSLHHILLYVAANWPVDLATYRRLTRLAVKRAVENGKILLVDGPGAAHYRLSPEERPTKEGAKGRKTEEEEEEPAKPAKRNTKNSAKAAPAKKRGAQQKSKPKRKAAEALDSPAPKKKKATKQRAGTDHAQKQAGEGKWVRTKLMPKSLDLANLECLFLNEASTRHLLRAERARTFLNRSIGL